MIQLANAILDLLIVILLILIAVRTSSEIEHLRQQLSGLSDTVEELHERIDRLDGIVQVLEKKVKG